MPTNLKTTPYDAEKIARLNDRVRHGLDRHARRVITRNCLAAFCNPDDTVSRIIAEALIMRAFRQCEFTEDSPERDMAWVELQSHRLMMKIDYYSPDMNWASEDPADASRTVRVMTIMLTSDY